MPAKIPESIYLFRIVHRENLEFILKNGMYAGSHPDKDPNYIFIGDSTLTKQREDFEIPLENAGNIGDYVAFYFCPRSPMLYNIITGHRGIPRRHQEEIIYLCCPIDLMATDPFKWCFTDGHAKNRLSSFYTHLEKLDKIDWSLRTATYWSNTDEDPDRQRRKQAEFLVKDYVPPACIHKLVVYNEAAKNYVQKIVAKTNQNIEIHVKMKHFYY